MKKTMVLVLLVVMLAGSVFAASSTVGGPLNDGFTDVGHFSIISNPEPRIGLAKTSDGGFVISGNSQTGLLLKYDSSANLVWQRRLSGISSPQDVMERSNGDLILAGGLGGSRHVALVADSSGNVLSSTGYRNFFQNGAYGVIPRSDGSYYIAGFEGGRGAASLLNIHSAGFTGSRYRGDVVPCLVSSNSRDQFTMNDIEKTHDDQILMVGATDLQGVNCPFYLTDLADAVLVKLAENGAVLWSMQYGDNNSTRKSEFYSAKSLSDGSIIAVGSNTEGSVGDHDVYVVKTDQNGNVLWQKLYGGIQRDVAYDVLASSDGGFVIVGTTTSFNSAGERDGWVIKLDSLGNILWQKRFGGVQDDRLSRVIELDDGSYVAAGMTYSFGVEIADVWVIKLDSNGNAASNCQVHPDTTAIVSNGVTGSYARPYYQEGLGSAVTSESTASVNPLLQVQSQCPSFCSDDVIQFGEACDTSSFFALDDHCFGSQRSCRTDCSACESRCGNSVIESGEECDDSNANSGDGCSSSCIKEDNDNDGAYDLDEIKYGTNRLDATSYPVQVYLRAFGHLYMEHYPGQSWWQQKPYIIFNPEVGAQITSVTDQNGNAVQLINTWDGQPAVYPYTGQWVVRKNSALRTLRVDMERQSYIYAGNNYNQMTFRGSTNVDVSQSAPYPAIGAQGNATFGVNIYVQKPYNANAATGAITGLVVDDSTIGEGAPLGSEAQGSLETPQIGVPEECCLLDDPSSPTGHSWPLTNGSSVPVRLERGNKQTLKGSELNIYEPVVLGEGEQQLNYIYTTQDNYWDVTTSLSLPVGCTADRTSASVRVDESTELATFNVYCGGSNLITAAAVGNPSSRANGAAQVVHSARDCTRPGCPPQRAASEVAVVASKGKVAAPRFQGQIVTPVQGSDNSYLWLAGFVLLVLGLAVVVWKAN